MIKFECNMKNNICPKICFACVDGYIIDGTRKKYYEGEITENNVPYPAPTGWREEMIKLKLISKK